ncbi:EamA family transporter [Pseudomonas sp. H3(2019)]|nr:EamA family transporter [Pseudomonas sp. H3(2019)]
MPYALLAAGFYGTSFWLHGQTILPVLDLITMLWLAYLVGFRILVLMHLMIKDGLKIPPLQNCMTLTDVSLMNLDGFSSFAWGAAESSVSVVTAISTLSGGIAVILGYVFFKERLEKGRVVGRLFCI